MNREIKFRAWDKKQKRWANLQLSEMEFTRDGLLRVGETIEYGTHAEFNDFELMQYTGLKDKNGKEIYESDIVYVEQNIYAQKHLTVEWEYDRWGFKEEFDNGDYYNGYAIRWEEVEVLGNIYEHKHLLDNTDTKVQNMGI